MRPSLTAEMADVIMRDRIEAAERQRQREEAKRLASESGGQEAATVRNASRKRSRFRQLALARRFGHS